MQDTKARNPTHVDGTIVAHHRDDRSRQTNQRGEPWIIPATARIKLKESIARVTRSENPQRDSHDKQPDKMENQDDSFQRRETLAQTSADYSPEGADCNNK